MSDAELQRWNGRFAAPEYIFGTAPNAFLAAQKQRLRPGQRALCVADGEGRNSVWLAERGFDVTAFDFAENAVAKARTLAKRRNVQVDHSVADMAHWTWAEDAYDALVAIFIQFLPPETRDAMFERMKAVVRPGGMFLLEGYRPVQVDYKTGGPPRREHMYTRAWLEARFTGWEIEVLEEYDAEIREGTAHGGMSALIDLVARKP